MRHIDIIKKLLVVLVAGLMATYFVGCGQADYADSSYKAESVVGGESDPVTITNEVSSPSEMNVGDVLAATFDDQGTSTIDFAGTDSSAQFVLAVSAIDVGQGTHIAQLSNGDISSTLADISSIGDSKEATWKSMDMREALDQQLRGAEMEMAVDPEISVAKPNLSMSGVMKAMVAAVSTPAVGDIESFKVLGGLSSLSNFTTVSAEARCVESKVIFYVDTRVTDANLSDSDISKLCGEFNETLTKEFEIFGEPSDVNGDGHVAVLMTPQVNMLGAMGGGIITGFFFANDLYAGSNSNNREIVYTLVPDATGTWGVTIPKSFAMDNLLPAVLPHEMQHAISYNQHVLVNKGRAEENWLNEGLSHLAEDLLGFGQENPSRVEVYLNDTESYGPITTGSPGLAERGAIFLLLRYLYEQADNGEQFIWNMAHTSLTGTSNIESAFAGRSEDFNQMSEFLLRWSATMIMSSFNISSDPKYSYSARTMNGDTNHLEGVCLNCDTQDGRGTILSGVSLATYDGYSKPTLEPTATKYYVIKSVPSKIKLAAATGGTYGATLVRFK